MRSWILGVKHDILQWEHYIQADSCTPNFCGRLSWTFTPLPPYTDPYCWFTSQSILCLYWLYSCGFHRTAGGLSLTWNQAFFDLKQGIFYLEQSWFFYLEQSWVFYLEQSWVFLLGTKLVFFYLEQGFFRTETRLGEHACMKSTL